MDNFDLRKYLAEGRLNENQDDSYYIEELAKSILKLKR